VSGNVQQAESGIHKINDKVIKSCHAATQMADEIKNLSTLSSGLSAFSAKIRNSSKNKRIDE